MDILFFLVVAYIGYLIIWLIICVVSWAISIVCSRNLMLGVLGFSIIYSWLLGFAILATNLYILHYLYTSGHLILVILFLLFGFGIFETLMSLLVFPFSILSGYLAVSVENHLKSKEEDYSVEMLTSEGKVERLIKSNNEINKNLASYFLISYLLYFLNVLTSLMFQKLGDQSWDFEYSFWMLIREPIIMAIISAILVGMFYMFRYRNLFPNGVKDFLAESYKVSSILWTLLWICLVFLFILS